MPETCYAIFSTYTIHECGVTTDFEAVLEVDDPERTLFAVITEEEFDSYEDWTPEKRAEVEARPLLKPVKTWRLEPCK